MLYSNEKKSSITKKQLFKLKQKTLERSKANYNKLFLYRTLGSIFSEEISTKYTKHSPNHNKELINNLLNEKDNNKKEYFNDLFNITFMDVLNHFRGTKYIDKLCGLKNFDIYCKELKYQNFCDEYIMVMRFYLMNFEDEIS